MHHLRPADAVALTLPWTHRAVGQSLALVGNDEVVVDADDSPETPAGVAGPHGRVEREEVRCRLTVVDVAGRAVEIRGVVPGFPGLEVGAEDVERHPTLAVVHRRLEVFAEALTVRRRIAGAILYHLYRRRRLRANACIPLLPEKLDDFRGVEIGRDRHGEGDHDSAVRRDLTIETVEDALWRVAAHLAQAGAAVQGCRTCKEQFQMIVELGHGADRGAGGAHRIGLVNGDCGRYPLDAVHLRFVHTVEELAGVGGEGLHVAPLPFGVDGVKGQRRLARATHSSDHNQFVEGKLETQVLEIVLTCPLDADGGPVCFARLCVLRHVELRA